MTALGPLDVLDDPEEQALEALTRRLLELLGRVTGLESTYLTSIDWDGGLQRILYARNVGSLDIPEGLEVDWSDTLCRRALEGGPTCTSDVQGTYPDSTAARELGLNTYVTVPVRGPEGDVVGTVCGADSRGIHVSEDAQAVMEALAEMVAMQLAGSRTRRELEATNRTLTDLAFVDGLTGIGNRRALDRDLLRTCEQARARRVDISIVSVDVDRFKDINDRLGHAAGDEVLCEVARRLTAHCRGGDVVARLGGDEFIAILVGTDVHAAAAVADRLCADVAGSVILTSGGPVRATLSVGVAASAGEIDPDGLLLRADQALYAAKDAGRNGVALDS